MKTPPPLSVAWCVSLWSQSKVQTRPPCSPWLIYAQTSEKAHTQFICHFFVEEKSLTHGKDNAQARHLHTGTTDQSKPYVTAQVFGATQEGVICISIGCAAGMLVFTLLSLARRMSFMLSILRFCGFPQYIIVELLQTANLGIQLVRAHQITFLCLYSPTGNFV